VTNLAVLLFDAARRLRDRLIAERVSQGRKAHSGVRRNGGLKAWLG